MSTWSLRYEGWSPDDEPLREALCTLGNGYVATRGAAEWSAAGSPHYPGTYLAAGYNRLVSEVDGRIVENEDLVNWPNWLSLTLRPQDGEWLSLDRADVLEFDQELDLRQGLLLRTLRWRDHVGRVTLLRSRRLVSMDDPHIAAIEWIVTPENWSGVLEIRSALDGTVVNANVARYRKLASCHLIPLESSSNSEDGISLRVRSSQSRIEMAQAARTLIWRGDADADTRRDHARHAGFSSETLHVECREGVALRVEKIVAIHTSRDRAISDPLLAARDRVIAAPDFNELLERHRQAWEELWRRCDIEIEPAGRAQMILRFHIFHLLQTVSPHTAEIDTGVPARGWHGEAYRGHIFWDELFIFPFLNLRLPDLTRGVLLYRHRRLAEARKRAIAAGGRGALFPWQSGSTGREETQVLHLNPRSGRWLPDNSQLQYHVNAAIAFNVWTYYQATGDLEFMERYGAEMILEIARFWCSIARRDEDGGRWHILGVMGPDEFHDAYPDSDRGGLNDNSYTNVMASWVLARAAETLQLLPEDRRGELRESLRITDEELSRWSDISRGLHVPLNEDGLVMQFEGYDELEELDWDAMCERHGDIQRLDRLLEAEGDTPNRYKASKQADVLMLLYLFDTQQLADIFQRLGVPFDPARIPELVDYYMIRTSHGSTLSSVVHSWVLARADRVRSWSLFQRALESDVGDVQGGTTAEGIHLGAMAGTVDLVQRCFLGVHMHDDVLWLDPRLPEALHSVRVTLHYRGHWLSVVASQEEIEVSFHRGRAPKARVGFQGEVHEIAQGQSLRRSIPMRQQEERSSSTQVQLPATTARRSEVV